MSDRELYGYPWRHDDDVRMLREFDRVKIEIDNALMSCNLQISRAESDLSQARERKRRLLERLEALQETAERLYWRRLIEWATTGRLI